MSAVPCRDSGASPMPKEHQARVTFLWIDENYETTDGICVPRNIIYQQYVHFCDLQAFQPVGPATFGKMVRQKFPNITTKRLGTRGLSRYHYYGLGIKPTSPYFGPVYTGSGLTRFSGTKLRWEGAGKRFAPGRRELAPIAVADVPPWKQIQRLPAMNSTDFISALLAAQNEEFLLVLNDALVPPGLQEVSSSHVKDASAFLDIAPKLVKKLVEQMPGDALKGKFLEAGKGRGWMYNIALPAGMDSFVWMVRKQFGILRCSSTVRAILKHPDRCQRMSRDLQALDIPSILRQARC
ncbi:unnamed protein product, partial [Darwinula stevensoni]